MSDIDPRTSLAELVTEHPHLARDFDGLGLDYCCGGTRTLEEACAATGLDVGEVQLSAMSVDIDDANRAWATMNLADLTAHIEATHHRYLRQELPRLLALADKVVAVHGDRHPELAAARTTLDELDVDLAPHLRREEERVFPMIRGLSDGQTATSSSVRESIASLCTEHDRAGELLGRLRRQTKGYVTPPDACTSYRAFYKGLEELEADLHLHVHKENNRLFPEAIELEASAQHLGRGHDSRAARNVVQVRLAGANCASCFDSLRTMLSEQSGVLEVHASFSGQCLEVALGTMSVRELTDFLRRNLHGIDVAGNGEQVMVAIDPSVGEWHCHR
jgi:regulator of cell morphogenesis and NO signaling